MATNKPAAAKTAAKKPAVAKAPANKSATGTSPTRRTTAASVRRNPEDMARLSMHFDFYGDLLSSKQRDVYHAYYEDNLTLSEIARTNGKTRQAIHETLKTTQIRLDRFEEVLGLIRKYEVFQETIESIETISAKILQDEAIVALKDKKDIDRIKRSLKKIISEVKAIE